MLFNQVATDVHAFPAGRRLSEIVGDMPVVQLFGPFDVAIAGVTTDSRCVRRSWLFAAVAGEHVDGHDFVQRAMENGASCVVVGLERFEADLRHLLTPAYCQHNGTTVLVVRDTREAVASLAARFHREPAKDLTLVGITGTNGKTTTSYLISAVLEHAGMRTGLIGTVEYRVADEVRKASFTTPPAEDVQQLLADMRGAGCTAAVMEVSSHALALKRVHGLAFDVSVFTNLTQDHLDFHKNMDAYRDAKALLFSRHTRGKALLNTDDAAAKLVGAGAGRARAGYGMQGRPAFRMRDLELTSRGSTLRIEHKGVMHTIESSLVGAFNAYNLTAAFATAVLLGIDPALVLQGLRKVKSVPGRFERIVSSDGVVGIVDYSHTPDALAKAIATARALAGTHRVITVFGCGGDRDQAKRPLMGAVAASSSDLTVVTSDNPRSEDPDAIIAAILGGVPADAEVVVKAARKSAIEYALKLATPGDIVLVAGKGHEDYQIVGTRRAHFDDREVVRNYFENKRGGLAA
ncbi:MAG TPA: UDP-N-acetylmuramoyl-L-alanyl-D-glutamate--2,6-diaminopimelate ligase [Bacteroidota bacterium]|nr:UDP-N-acetylmuramoyl-L-alanyl-D-glutamate--2,6-diaminopimelate ligase [Bacteroidota bacterium]